MTQPTKTEVAKTYKMTTEITRYDNMCEKCKLNFEDQIEQLLQIAFRLLSETPGNNSVQNSTAFNLLKYMNYFYI